MNLKERYSTTSALEQLLTFAASQSSFLAFIFWFQQSKNSRIIERSNRFKLYVRVGFRVTIRTFDAVCSRLIENDVRTSWWRRVFFSSWRVFL